MWINTLLIFIFQLIDVSPYKILAIILSTHEMEKYYIPYQEFGLKQSSVLLFLSKYVAKF